MLNPMWLSPELDVGSRQNVVESIPVSRFKPYLSLIFGPGVPTSDSDRRLTDTFFDIATQYSTDESLDAIITDRRFTPAQVVESYIPRWLSLTEPLVDIAAALRKASAAHLAPYGNDDIPSRYDHEMVYMTNVFYASTQLASVALDIPHPSQTYPGLQRPGQYKGTVIGGMPGDLLPQTILLDTPVVKREHRQKADLLKAKTEVLNIRAMKAAERMIAVTQAIQAKKELHILLGE